MEKLVKVKCNARSVLYEICFSKMSILITDRRLRHKTESVEKMIFLIISHFIALKYYIKLHFTTKSCVNVNWCC